jgi:hypothetical protein
VDVEPDAARVKASVVGALCANHTGTSAVEICSRCGAFLCGECVLYVREVVPVCATCRPFAENDGPPSRAAWGAPALAVLGLGLILSGFFIRARTGLVLWGTSLLPGGAGLFLSIREFRRIARHQAPHRGRWLARLGLVFGVLFSLVALGLLAGFTLFVRRAARAEY